MWKSVLVAQQSTLAVTAVIAALTCCSIASGADSNAEQAKAQLEFFELRIRPALIDHCLECHAADTETSGGLNLDSAEGWKVGGDLGPAIEMGNPDDSLLIRAIEYADTDLQMPPDGKLPANTIADFRKWIQNGAVDPRKDSVLPAEEPLGLSVDRAQEHWAYRPIETARPTATKMRTSTSRIDAFVDQRLRSEALTPAPRANKSDLIRRLTFDLTGLPPAPSEVQAFLADDSPAAYTKLVNRLLASPAYAEHTARRWLDVVRYAESITLRGFVLPNAWRYRDYVIESYSIDRPFRDMVIHQIAGDLLPASDPGTDDLHDRQQAAIATAFLAMGNSNLEDQDKSKLEFDHIDEQLETIGRAFMGQTIGCARCHDHKFDPIPTRDYYAIAGIFRSTVAMRHANLSQWIDQPLPLDETQQQVYRETEATIAKLDAELVSVKKQLQALDTGLDKKHSKQKSIPSKSLEGVVVDEQQATFVGEWTESMFLPPFVDAGYSHDNGAGRGQKTATFEPANIKPGVYKVRMSYSHSTNRASNVRVQVFSANESATVIVNQRKRPDEDGMWVSLGEYPFEQDGQAFVIVSNAGADGHVIVDAVQFLPVRSASPKKAEKTDAALMSALAKQREGLESKLDGLTKHKKGLQASLDQRPKYLTIRESEPKQDVAIRIRGLVGRPGERVPRGVLTAFGPADQYASQISGDQSGRLELANWLVDPSHPLTARVYANRVWSWLTGDGLVATENNFGTTGETPSHPQLLDDLASGLLKNDWSTKKLMREIVHSEAYCRAIVAPSEIATNVDPENRLHWSANLKPLPVEALRDAMLAFSGELDRTMGGKTIRSGTGSDYNYNHDLQRRSIYSPVLRNSLPDLFEVFNFADPSVSVGQRTQSVVPTQSLAILNQPWVIARSHIAAQRWTEPLDDQTNFADREFPERMIHLLDRIYLHAVGRLPNATERQTCLDCLDLAEVAQNDQPHEHLREQIKLLIQAIFASLDFRYLN